MIEIMDSIYITSSNKNKYPQNVLKTVWFLYICFIVIESDTDSDFDQAIECVQEEKPLKEVPQEEVIAEPVLK